MNWYTVLQNIITWALTGFAVSCFMWAAKTSKRITKLEEHEVSVKEDIAELKTKDLNADNKLDTILAQQIKMNTTLELLMEGKIRLKGGKNANAG